MFILKQSTAVDVLIGPFVDSTDGYTAETALSPSVKLSKNGQTLAAKNDVTTPVHDADGYYNCELDATDTNTIGTLVLTVAGSATALPVRHEFQVVEEAVYTAFYDTSADGVPAQMSTTIDQRLVTIGLDHLVTNAVAGTDIANNSIIAKLVSSSATADWDDYVNTTDSLQAIRDHVGDGTNLTEAGGTGDHLSAIPIVTANVTQIGGDAQSATDLKDFADAGYDPVTNKVEGVKLVDTTTTNTDMITAAAVNAEVDTALADIHLDHLIASADPGAVVANNSFLAKLVSASATATFSDYVNTTDSLQALRDHVGDGTNLTEAGGTGDHLSAIPIVTANVTQWNSSAVATPSVAGVPEVDVTHFGGVAADTDANGRVRFVVGTAAGELNTTNGLVGLKADSVDANSVATDGAEEIADSVLTKAMTESYAADGVAPSVAQALHLLIAANIEKSVSGTTVTLKKLDGATTAATLTLDDGTNPTSVTRAT